MIVDLNSHDFIRVILLICDGESQEFVILLTLVEDSLVVNWWERHVVKDWSLDHVEEQRLQIEVLTTLFNLVQSANQILNLSINFVPSIVESAIDRFLLICG